MKSEGEKRNKRILDEIEENLAKHRKRIKKKMKNDDLSKKDKVFLDGMYTEATELRKVIKKAIKKQE